jgi:hypothetical protein
MKGLRRAEFTEKPMPGVPRSLGQEDPEYFPGREWEIPVRDCARKGKGRVGMIVLIEKWPPPWS